MKTLQIKRSKWARGGMNGESALLNRQGAMCCLGFYCKKLGASNKQLKEVLEPSSFVDGRKNKAPWIEKLKGLVRKHGGDTALCSGMMLDNDTKTECSTKITTEAQRESEIAKGFKKLGWNVKFVH